MPIYAYRCSSCGLQKDHLQKMSDPAITECPECGKATYGKMLTAPQFQLKGSGWYVTDFRNGGSKPSADSGKSEGGKSDGAKEGGEAKKDASASDSGSKESSTASKESASKDSGSSSAAPAASAG